MGSDGCHCSTQCYDWPFSWNWTLKLASRRHFCVFLLTEYFECCVYVFIHQKSLESSVNSVCFFCKWSVAIVTVFRRMEFVSSLDTHFMMGGQRNTQCYDWPFSWNWTFKLASRRYFLRLLINWDFECSFYVFV